MPFDQGPFLSAAVICEKVLVEQDNVKSAIRIIDRVMHTVQRPDAPLEMQPFQCEVALFLQFKAGRARGPHRLSVMMLKPSGETQATWDQPLHFEGEDDRGVDVIATLKLLLEMQGPYWFRVAIDDELVTRIPLRVIYLPAGQRRPA